MKYSKISNIKYIFSYMFKFGKNYMLMTAFISLIETFQSVINILLMKFVIDNILLNNIKEVIIAIVLAYTTIFIITIVSNLYRKTYSNILKQKISFLMKQEFYNAVLKINMEDYDNPEYYNSNIKTIQDFTSITFELYDDVVSIIVKNISICTLISIVIILDPFIILFSLANILINVFVNTHVSKLEYSKRKDTILNYRKEAYYDRVFYLPQYAKELRLFNISNNIIYDFGYYSPI